MISQVDIAAGLVASASDASAATSVLENFRVDAAGANVPRPGLRASGITGLGSYPLIGAYRFRDQVVVVDSNRYIYRIPDATPLIAIALSTTTTTTQLGGIGRPVFAEDASDLFIAGGGPIQRWSPGDLTTSRLGGSSPTMATHVAVLGQRVLANDNSSPTVKDRFYYSDIGDAVSGTWSTADFIATESRTDPVVALYENTAELFVFGTASLQVFAIGTDPYFPYDPVVTQNIGCAAPHSPTRWDDAFYFLDDSRRIVLTDGRSSQVASEAIAGTLRGMTTVSDCWGFRKEQGNDSLLYFQFPSEKRTLVYEPVTKKWSEDRYYTNGVKSEMPIGAYCYSPKYNHHLVGSSIAGALYRFDTATTTDVSNPLVCERVTGWTDHGSQKRKRSVRVMVMAKRGTALVNTTPGILELRVQNDDSAWSEWEQISIGGPGEIDQMVPAYLGGVFRRRRYHLRYSNTDSTAIVGLYDDVTELVN